MGMHTILLIKICFLILHIQYYKLWFLHFRI